MILASVERTGWSSGFSRHASVLTQVHVRMEALHKAQRVMAAVLPPLRPQLVSNSGGRPLA